MLSMIAKQSCAQTGVELSLNKAFICPKEQITLSVKNYDDPYPSIYLQYSTDTTRPNSFKNIFDNSTKAPELLMTTGIP